MKERPILFSGPMVRAILDGRKTQTRRVLKGSMEFKGPYNPAYLEVHKNAPGWKQICPHGAPGDRLWVCETWFCATGGVNGGPDLIHYRADFSPDEFVGLWRPSIFMPRWASRITLEITDVRVQRLQEISCADALAEGITPTCNQLNIDCASRDPRKDFKALWDSINAKRGFGWAANSWVWAITFRRAA